MSNFINAFRRHRCKVSQVSTTISNTDSETGFVKVDTNRCFWDHFVSPFKLIVTAIYKIKETDRQGLGWNE